MNKTNDNSSFIYIFFIQIFIFFNICYLSLLNFSRISSNTCFYIHCSINLLINTI